MKQVNLVSPVSKKNKMKQNKTKIIIINKEKLNKINEYMLSKQIILLKKTQKI